MLSRVQSEKSRVLSLSHFFSLLGVGEPGRIDRNGICVEIFRNSAFCKGQELVKRISGRRQHLKCLYDALFSLRRPCVF